MSRIMSCEKGHLRLCTVQNIENSHEIFGNNAVKNIIELH